MDGPMAIPLQVGLHQSMSPLQQPLVSVLQNQQNEHDFSINGEPSNTNCLTLKGCTLKVYLLTRPDR
jgi:hypothetical protein